MAVNDSGYNPTVDDMCRAGCMVWLGLPGADRLITGPVALYLQAVLVDTPAAPAIVSWDVVLERLCLYSSLLSELGTERDVCIPEKGSFRSPQ